MPPPDFPQRLVTTFFQALATYLLILLIFTLQDVFDTDFECSCRPGVHWSTVLFIVLPPLILAWLLKLIEPSHEKSFLFGWYFQRRNVLCSCLCKCVVDYIILGVAWWSAVLFKGGWYLCLQTSLNPAAGIPCRKDLDDREKLILALHKTTPLNYGLIAISCFLLFWCFGELIPFGDSELKRRPHYRVFYEELLGKEVKSCLENQLPGLAKQHAKTICEPRLQEIWDYGRKPKENSDDAKALDQLCWGVSASDFHTANQKQGEEEKPLGSQKDELVLGKVDDTVRCEIPCTDGTEECAQSS